ncbi:MAG: secretion system protein F, partial [Gammaproteobacteria bacterium]|nr:secretion system protein F [Gammaproteobacteria bacterium]
METLLTLSGDVTFLLAVASVFLATTFLWLLVLQKSQHLLEEYKDTFTSTASSNMADMFLFIDPNRLFIINVAAIIVLPVLIWIISRDVPATLAVLVMAILLPSMVYKSMRKRRLSRFEQQLPDALAMISGAMRAGASLNIALEGLVKEQPAPISQEFELLLKEQRLGVDFDESLKG